MFDIDVNRVSTRLTTHISAVVVIAALVAVIPDAAEAQLHKCRNSAGAITYRDTPCPPTEQSQSVDRAPPSSPRRNSYTPKSGEPGLWETVLIARPRASHPKENAWFQNAPRQELEKAGDYKYFLGVPMKLHECRASSPIEEMLRKWGFQCERQIKAQGGTCEVTDLEPTTSGSRESVAWITGDYRSELHVKSRIVQGKDDNGKQVYDDADTHIRYLGPCMAYMRPGDTFLVGDDGKLVKQK